jgi:type IV pilus assembly protein PilM
MMASPLDALQRLRHGIRGTHVPQVLGGSVLGLDIGTTSIKAVQLGGEPNAPALDTYGTILLDRYAPEGGQTLGAPVIGGALADLLHEIQAAARGGGASLPQTACFMTTMQVPKRDLEQMRRILPIEAKQYVPVPLETVQLEWGFFAEQRDPDALLRQSQAEGVMTSQRTVVMVAIERAARAMRERALKEAGVTGDFLEPEFFSYMRAHEHSQKGPLLILDFGASATRIALYDTRGQPLGTRLAKGGDSLTRALAEAFAGDVRAAEDAKRRFIAQPDTFDAKTARAVHTAIDAFTASVKEEILTALEPHKEIAHPLPVSAIGGGHALAAHIAADWWNTHGMAPVSPDLFAGISLPVILADSIHAAGPRYATAIGLALRALRRTPGATTPLS